MSKKQHKSVTNKGLLVRVRIRSVQIIFKLYFTIAGLVGSSAAYKQQKKRT